MIESEWFKVQSLRFKVHTEEQFDFERLEVYKKAVEFVNDIYGFSEKLPGRAQYSLGDQIRRAALGIINNIAEGSDKRFRDKIKFYEYSLNSARECVPMLTIARDQKLLTGDIHDKLRRDCFIICKMLRKLISSVYR